MSGDNGICCVCKRWFEHCECASDVRIACELCKYWAGHYSGTGRCNLRNIQTTRLEACSEFIRKSSWMQIAGKWPGEETDEEIERLLSMTNERKHITQPDDWWAAFKAEADKDGTSLSEWLGAAGLEKLPKKVAKKLSKRPPANRPKKSEQ